MNTAPREEGDKSISSRQAEKVPLTRLEQMRKADRSPSMPDLPAPFLIEWLMEIGPTEAAGMGAGPISWRSLEAWQSCTGIAIAPWQARLLRRLSGDWLRENDRARNPKSLPPWRQEPTEADWKAMERNLERLFDGL